MTASSDPLARLVAVGAIVGRRVPAVVGATIGLLEAVEDATRPSEGEGEEEGLLHEFLRRVLGWSPEKAGEVNNAAREVHELATGRGALLLIGAGWLVGVGRRLHRLTLPDRPFVVFGPAASIEPALESAAGGTLFVDTRHLPRDLAPLVEGVRDPTRRVRLMVGASHVDEVGDLAAMLPRVATIAIPPLTERPEELVAVIEAYIHDAAAELGAKVGPSLRDLVWLRSSMWVVTLDEIEEATRRLVAIRAFGVTEAAARLGVTHGAISRWARRRGLPT